MIIKRRERVIKCTLRERSKRAFASREYRRTTDWPQCSKKHRPDKYYGELRTTSQGIVPLTTGGHLDYVLWEFRQSNPHSESINKPLVDEILNFPDINYRNNNYVENLHANGNNENKNIIFTAITQTIPIQVSFWEVIYTIVNLLYRFCKLNILPCNFYRCPDALCFFTWPLHQCARHIPWIQQNSGAEHKITYAFQIHVKKR